MVSGCDLVVSICLNTLDRVVRIVIELIKHHLVYLVIDWHGLLAWKQPVWLAVLLLLEPRMASHVVDRVSLFRICVQDLGHEVGTVLRQELRKFEVTC